jgi:alcohol dehydrogenase YqhD (iron-dependent ADH family)
MNNFTFQSPTEFIFGRQTENQVGKLCSKYGAKKVLIIYGGGSVVRSGLLQQVITSLQSADIEYIEMSGVQPNPTDPKVYEGIDLVRKNGINFLLALGGGSVIDTTKAIAAGALYDGDFWDFYCGKAIIEKAMKLGTVLTIPAAGSEGSGNSVITKLEGLHKISLRSPEYLRPTFSIMDPELTYTLPPKQTAAGICDMMVHISERYFTNTPDVETGDYICEGLYKAIIEEGPKVMKNPKDYEARANIMWAGMIAHNWTSAFGMQECWCSHFMEHEVSAVYNVTHGAGLAVIFPAWLTFMASHNVHKPYQFATRVWDVPIPENGNKEAAALEGVRRLKAFWRSIGLPTNFKELGIEQPDIDLLVRKLHEDKGELVGSYLQLSRKDTQQIYELANK